MEQVTLKRKAGKVKKSIQEAERILNARKVGVSQSWKLDDPDYSFKSGKIVKKPKKQEKDVEKEK